ncbi:MAG: hypothetical protein ACRDYC_10995 [Acidimicrobiales bacterium]
MASSAPPPPEATPQPSQWVSPADEPEEHEMHTALPPKVEHWRKRSAVGAILTGLAMGFREALEADRKAPSIVIETSGDPPEDLAVEAHLERGSARHNVVRIRPWLLPGGDEGFGEENATEPRSDEASREATRNPADGMLGPDTSNSAAEGSSERAED